MPWVVACRLDDLPVDQPYPVEAGGEPVVIVRTADGLFALADECSHAQVRLSFGTVDGCHLECFAHGAWFDLRTGAALGPPAPGPVHRYPTRVRQGTVEIDLAR